MTPKFPVKKLFSMPIVSKMPTMSPNNFPLKIRQIYNVINTQYKNYFGGESLSLADWKQDCKSSPLLTTGKMEGYGHSTRIGQETLPRNLHYYSHPLRNKSEKAEESQASNITYSIVSKVQSDKISKFLIQNYHTQEPITVALGMHLKEVDGWFKRFIRRAMFASVNDVSVQALDEKNQRRVGILCSTVYDPKFSRPVEDDYTNPKEHPIYTQMNEFYEVLEKGLDPAEAAGVKEDAKFYPKILEHLFICVDPDYQHQGISNKMVALSESIATNTIMNCRVGYTIATSEYSYPIFLKHGYKVVRECKYSDYANSKGEKIFVGKEAKLNPHHTCRAMVKEFKCLF